MIHNEYMQEIPRINEQDRQKITFPGSANPRRSPNSSLQLHTQKQCTARGSSWGFSIHLWPPKAPGSTFGGGSQSLSSALWCQYPNSTARLSLTCYWYLGRNRSQKQEVVHLKTLRREMQTHGFDTVSVLSVSSSAPCLRSCSKNAPLRGTYAGFWRSSSSSIFFTSAALSGCSYSVQQHRNLCYFYYYYYYVKVMFVHFYNESSHRCANESNMF